MTLQNFHPRQQRVFSGRFTMLAWAGPASAYLTAQTSLPAQFKRCFKPLISLSGDDLRKPQTVVALLRRQLGIHGKKPSPISCAITSKLDSATATVAPLRDTSLTPALCGRAALPPLHPRRLFCCCSSCGKYPHKKRLAQIR